MLKSFKYGESRYYFDSLSLKLYKNKVIKKSAKDEEVNNCESNKRKLYKLVIDVANKCNLNCKYCYEYGGTFGRESFLMTKGVFDEIFSSLRKNYDFIQTVYFFGGEPLINFPLIKYIINNINKKYKINDYRIVTNGILITNEMIELFEQNNFKIYISLDGPEFIHSYLRGPGFNKIINSIEKMKKTQLKEKMELICTYTKYHEEKIKIEDLVSFYENIGLKYSISDVISHDKSLAIKKSFSKKIELEKEYINKTIERINTNSLNVGISYFVRNILDALVYKQSSDVFCKELENDYSHVYDYNGDLYPCIRLISTFKSNSKEITESNHKSSNICLKCWARGLCSNCTADILLKNNLVPYKKKYCYKKLLYYFAFYKIISEIENNKIDQLLNNYFNKYLF